MVKISDLLSVEAKPHTAGTVRFDQGLQSGAVCHWNIPAVIMRFTTVERGSLAERVRKWQKFNLKGISKT